MKSGKLSHSLLVGSILASEPAFVPDVSAVVSPAVLAQVFEGETIPFALNPDGSVKTADYVAWLTKIGKAGLQAFEQDSEILMPGKAARNQAKNKKTKTVV